MSQRFFILQCLLLSWLWNAVSKECISIHGIFKRLCATYYIFRRASEMSAACSTHGKMRNTTFWSKNLKRRDRWEDLGINGRIMLDRILGK